MLISENSYAYYVTKGAVLKIVSNKDVNEKRVRATFWFKEKYFNHAHMFRLDFFLLFWSSFKLINWIFFTIRDSNLVLTIHYVYLNEAK